MGTLTNQTPRKSFENFRNAVLDEIEEIQIIAKKTGLSFDQVLETRKMLEMERKNNLYFANGDIFDEQMMGLGELLEEFIDAFKESFGVSQFDDAPKFLEAIAIQLGYDTRYGNNTIPDAIRKLKDE